ncbi:hypothetical protein [Aerosakkonema funiforme]|uniref:Uncharacterized protein n=1 Tax=Aerosakkonema funiforme FACHB-1375 TaxID=2949571 RepID=A0A926VEA8_9CYAN|nr:hypothetical protein [Aerosakkonema funiforme]MBD2182143.1 hypothetical protein [Aerosakkonema funiforme FACHB-1375]
MKFLKLLAQTILYIIIVLNLIFIVVIGKIAASIICEELIYKILIIGDLFAILDIGEFVNIIVFALLGMGFGMASALLPKYAQTKTSAVLLIILVPILFSTSAFVKYNYWVEDFADRENISFAKAEEITNSFLQKKVNAGGFFGFYSYTAQFPVLPTKMSEITKIEDLEKKVKSDFISLGKIAKLKPEVVYGLLASGSWAIRFFYFSLAALATVYHFHLGQAQVFKWFQPAPPKFPPIPPRFKPPANKPLMPSSPRRVRNH